MTKKVRVKGRKTVPRKKIRVKIKPKASKGRSVKSGTTPLNPAIPADSVMHT